MSAPWGLGAQPVTLERHFRMLQRISIETDDETCCLSRRPLVRGSTGFVSESLRGSSGLEDAMRRIARAYNLLHGGTFNRVEHRADRLVYQIDDDGFPFVPETGAETAKTVMEGVMIFLHTMLSLAVVGDLDPWLRVVHVRRNSASTEPLDDLLTYWRVPVRYQAGAYKLEYAPRAASLSVHKDLSAFSTHDVYARILASIEARDPTTVSRSLVDQVRAVLAEGQTAQTVVARRLGLSVATLRRRLAACGIEFRGLRAEALARRAKALLARGRAVPDVAEALGFSDARSFSRAFKSWYAITPTQYRSIVEQDDAA